jgi:hypothetical protein
MTQRWNNRVDIHHRGLFIDAVERRRAAYHEAAHAVVGYWFGLRPDAGGITVDQPDYYYRDSRRRRELFLDLEQAEVCTSLAGRLAENLLYPLRVQPPSDDELLTILAFACWDCEWPDDEDGSDDFLALRRLREARDTVRDEDLLAAYRGYQAATIALLVCPSIWQSVERIATALLERGTLTDDEASALLVGGVFAGALQAQGM